jgi:hypothetical protein
MFSPISLRYIAALRGNKPKKTGVAFCYAEAACTAPEDLICLAASNPEGRFYGFMADDNACRKAEEIRIQRSTANVVFLTGMPSILRAHLADNKNFLPKFDYLCCDESLTPLPAVEHAALISLAEECLNPCGLFVTSYCAYNCGDGALRFLVRELAPEMDSEQKQDFLTEIKKLGTAFFFKNLEMADALDKAIAERTPQDFFSLFDKGVATSATFDTLVAVGVHGFAYAGDASLASNYVELVVPHEAQDIIVSCRNSPLYEPIKDFALNRTMRSDIWIKAPLELSSNPAELFGGFAYGIVIPREKIPSAYAAKGKRINLSSSLYAKVLDLMEIMPIGVGDVLAHPSGQGENPEKILEVFQMLVACGFASPMRGALTAINNSPASNPHFVGNFNRFVDQTTLTGQDVLFASEVAGCGVVLPARDAFVMQAINRGGLNGSVKAIMPELHRIANTPAAISVIKTEKPTAQIAQAMILETLAKSLPQWYAFALLEAA